MELTSAAEPLVTAPPIIEKLPVCPACRGPLATDLVAAACNTVFHRACLAAVEAEECPQCGEAHGAGTAIHLFGVSFGETPEPSVAARRLALIAEQSSEDQAGRKDEPTARAVRLRTAAALLKKREEVRGVRRTLAEHHDRLDAMKKNEALQREKLSVARKAVAKLHSEVASIREKTEREAARRKTIEAQLNLRRHCEATHEYWDKLKVGDDVGALKYLTTMVSLSGAPWRTLAEVARLKEYSRRQFDSVRKQSSAAAARLAEVRQAEREWKRSRT